MMELQVLIFLMAAAFGTLAAIINYGRKGKIPWKAALWGMPFALMGSAIGARMLVSLNSDFFIHGNIILALILLLVTCNILGNLSPAATSP